MSGCLACLAGWRGESVLYLGLVSALALAMAVEGLVDLAAAVWQRARQARRRA